jgi:hypothetical protein
MAPAATGDRAVVVRRARMWNDAGMRDRAGTPPPPEGSEWTGPRPRVGRGPAIVGAAIIALALLVILATLTRSPDIVAQLSQDYVAMMAGRLEPAILERDPQLLGEALSANLPDALRVPALDPEFQLRGGRSHEVDGRRAAVWFYEAPHAELALAEAVDVPLSALPEPDETRPGPGPLLRIYRKQTQTVVAWQEGALVYVFISTLPGEQVIALARRMATAGSDPS